MIRQTKLDTKFPKAAESRGGDPPEYREPLAEPFSELSNPIKFSWKSGREKISKLVLKFFLGFFGHCWSLDTTDFRQDIGFTDAVWQHRSQSSVNRF